MSIFRQSASGAAAILAVSTAPVNFVAGDFGLPKCPYVRMQVQDDAVIITYDGTDPSAINGELVTPGPGGYFLREDILAMKFIRVTTDARVWAQPCDGISPAN